MKVQIKYREVYHKTCAVEITVPDDLDQSLEDFLIENEHLYVSKVKDKLHKLPMESGLGLGDGFEDTWDENEWIFQCDEINYGGHL